jgi:hypothetical protein
MPVTYHIDQNEGLITLRAQGELTLRALINLGRAMIADHSYAAEFPQLLDFRGMRVVPTLPQGAVGPVAPTSDLDLLKQFVFGPYRDHTAGNIAVVIDQHLESEHCADIYLLTCAIAGAELFADYELALKWLMRQEFVAAAAGR